MSLGSKGVRFWVGRLLLDRAELICFSLGLRLGSNIIVRSAPLVLWWFGEGLTGWERPVRSDLAEVLL